METQQQQWPVKILMLSLAGSLILIIVSCYVIQNSWMQSAFGK